ncbi:MAG: glycosyltransferase family 4 protein [Kiritimatiellales bacterium]|nr:glycosyltransferase family 4 protein [Kiritimatiellales bacterium]
MPPASAGFHLIGFLSGNFGLGEAARNTLRIMLKKGLPVICRDLDTKGPRTGQNQEFAARCEKRPDYWPFDINLFHFNPLELKRLLLTQWPKIPLNNRLNVIVPFWELPVLPQEWVDCLRAMDCILAPTKYIQEIIQKNLPDKPVVYFPQSIPVGARVAPDRSRLGLPQDAFIFLCAFDIMSDVERKNPWGTLAAFKQAFPDNPDVRLVIKTNQGCESKEHTGALLKITQLIGDDPRILLLTEMLSTDDLFRLYASADALVSLHRAEGLGLIIMEMMAQAKPVVVTAWSGNMDFTTSENACLVDFRMVPIQATHPEYKDITTGPQAYWADADTESAAAWMQKLASDAPFREQIGQNARESMLARADIDRSPVFEQLRAQYTCGLRRSRETLHYFKSLRKKAKKYRNRQRIRRIERAVKKLVRR